MRKTALDRPACLISDQEVATRPTTSSLDATDADFLMCLTSSTGILVREIVRARRGALTFRFRLQRLHHIELHHLAVYRPDLH